MSALSEQQTWRHWRPRTIGRAYKILAVLSLQPCRPAARQKILARRCEYIDQLTVLVAPSFVLGAAGDYDDAPRFEHAALLIDAKFHLALEHPNELFVWMRMSGHMRSRSYLPPHHHALLASYHPARNLVGDFFLRDRRKRPETCERSHGVFSFELPERPHGRNLALPEQGMADISTRSRGYSGSNLQRKSLNVRFGSEADVCSAMVDIADIESGLPKLNLPSHQFR